MIRGLKPIHLKIAAAGDVGPFDNRRSIEVFRRNRPAHDKTGFVNVTAIDQGRVSIVHGRVLIRRAFYEELFLNVTLRREIEVRRIEGIAVRRIGRFCGLGGFVLGSVTKRLRECHFWLWRDRRGYVAKCPLGLGRQWWGRSRLTKLLG